MAYWHSRDLGAIYPPYPCGYIYDRVDFGRARECSWTFAWDDQCPWKGWQRYWVKYQPMLRCYIVLVFHFEEILVRTRVCFLSYGFGKKGNYKSIINVNRRNQWSKEAGSFVRSFLDFGKMSLSLWDSRNTGPAGDDRRTSASQRIQKSLRVLRSSRMRMLTSLVCW